MRACRERTRLGCDQLLIERNPTIECMRESSLKPLTMPKQSPSLMDSLLFACSSLSRTRNMARNPPASGLQLPCSVECDRVERRRVAPSFGSSIEIVRTDQAPGAGHRTSSQNLACGCSTVPEIKTHTEGGVPKPAFEHDEQVKLQIRQRIQHAVGSWPHGWCCHHLGLKVLTIRTFCVTQR